MLNKICEQIPEKILSLNEIAEQLSVVMPRFIRHMYPHMYKSIDVPPAQVFVLLTVQEEKTCNLTDLSHILDITAPTASGLVDRLVKKKYLKRLQNQKDRRAVNITLTQSGEQLIKKFQKNVLEMWKKNLKSFAPEERMGPLLFIKQLLKDIEKMKKTIQIGLIACSLILGSRGLVLAQDSSKIYELSLSEATDLALKNNFDIQMAKYDAFISETSLETVKSIFDTILDANVNYRNDQGKKTSVLYGTKTVDNDYNLGLSKKFASGTTLEANMYNNRNWTDSSSASSALNHDSTLSLSLTQELGKNFFGVADRGNIDITKIDIENSQYSSLEKIETVLSAVKKAYWDLVLQLEDVKIQKDMVDQAKRLYDLHQEKLKDGLVEKPEAIASEANYKARSNSLLLEENSLKTKENILRLLLNIDDDQVTLIPSDNFNLNLENQSFIDSLKIAFDNRRDYLKAKNTVQSKDIKLVVEKNNNLPKINLIASLAQNGLGDHFKQSVANILDDDNINYSVGLTFSLPIENRDAKAKLKKAEYEKAKALIDLKLIERQVTIEINDQVRNCNIFKEIASNSIDIAQLQAQKLEEEEKRYNAGRSDTDTLIRYQEDLIQAKKTAVSDKFRFYSALVDLDLKKGILLGTYTLR